MRLYPAAFKPPLVNIALVGVVVPLDAVQRGSSVGVHSLQQSNTKLIQEDE
jgi:hypothetical protein